MIFNEKKVWKFTKDLWEISFVQKVSIPKTLEIIGKGNKDKEIRITAEFLKEQLENGFSFSSGLMKCESVYFDQTYVNFINIAEKTGKIGDGIEFLKKRCERQEKNFRSIVEASVYPVFVIILCFAAILSLQIIGEKFYGKNIFNQVNSWKVFGIGGFIVFFAVLMLEILKKCVGENKLYEAMLGISFLVKAGIPVADSVGYGAFIAGEDTGLGKIFINARERLEYGMDLVSAFGTGIGNGVFSKNLEEALFYAQMTGNKADVFEKLALWLEKSDERKRKLCLSLLEPVFILFTGIILILLMVNFLFPVIGNTDFTF